MVFATSNVIVAPLVALIEGSQAPTVLSSSYTTVVETVGVVAPTPIATYCIKTTSSPIAGVNGSAAGVPVNILTTLSSSTTIASNLGLVASPGASVTWVGSAVYSMPVILYSKKLTSKTKPVPE